MKYRVFLYFVLCFVIFAAPLNAQNKEAALISGTFNNITAQDFLLQLEKQTGYRFYFDTLQLDSIKIDISIKDLPLSAALDLAFKNTRLNYTIDNQRNIFVTKGLKVQAELPQGFFMNVNGNEASQQNNFFSLTDTTGKPQNATQENKLYIIGDERSNIETGGITIAGYIRDSKNGEPVNGASVYIENPRMGVVTDQFGYYSFTIPKGRHTLFVQSIGMRDTKRQLLVKSSGKINIETQSVIMTLNRVIISSEKKSNIRSLQMGVQKIDIKTIKQVPVAFGEADILKVVLMLPGVKTVGEASTGLNVRGGSADQNLILFNDATIYNPSHFFGMFAAFNPEVVNDVELFKSSVPAKYGGRLSSVLEINSREGNKKNISGTAGIGLLTSRLNIEGPLIKDKSSFIIGGRSTYSDWLTNYLPQEYKNSKAGFYDLNLNINHQIDKQNSIFLTAYMSKDRFNLNSDTAYQYGNQNISLKFKHLFNNKFYMVVTTGYDHYEYGITSEKNPVNAYKLAFDINQYYLRTLFNYHLNNNHTLEFGLSTLYYKLHPGGLTAKGPSSLVVNDIVQQQQALETALHFSDKFTINDELSVEAGIRYSLFNILGPYSVNNYPADVPKTVDNIISTTIYAKGKIIKTYQGPEFRLSARYLLSSTLSLKAAYNTQRQYIHMLSNTAAISPTDIWKLSDPNIKPQFGNQFSLGLFKNFKSNTIETSVEVYYKNIRNFLDYKSGAILLLNQNIETDVINTKGKAYGVEVLLKKLSGKLNGWVSYTYSRTLLKVDDAIAGESINNGLYYPANYDKPHDFTFVGNYRINHRFSISLNTTYSTGRPITLPIGRFYYAGAYRTLYGERNAYRIPDYFRTDFSMNIEGNHKVHQKTHNSWTIGVYNLLGRKNPYSVYFISENSIINGYQLSIFGNPIPYINFNIRF